MPIAAVVACAHAVAIMCAVFSKGPPMPCVAFGVSAVAFIVVAACAIAYALLLRG